MAEGRRGLLGRLERGLLAVFGPAQVGPYDPPGSPGAPGESGPPADEPAAGGTADDGPPAQGEGAPDSH